jgi:C4-dicarboxylate-binding protein DctP
MNWNRIFVYAAAVVLLSLVTGAIAACAPQRGAPAPAVGPGETGFPKMTLKFNHVVARDTPKHKAAERFAQLVRERTNGAIEIQVFPNSELYKDGEEIEALQTGAIHFIAPGTDKFGVLVPEWEATALPYVFSSVEGFKQFEDPDNPVAKELFEKLRPKGLLGMAIWENGWKHFSSSKRPLIVPDDFKGQKFRTSGKPDEAFVKALGGSAVVMAFSEVFSALQQGVVDGQFNTWNNIYTQKFHEVQRYATSSDGAVILLYGVATNAQWWDSLDSQTRQVLFDALKEATKYGNELAAAENRIALEKIKASGRLEIHVQTPEEAALWRVAGEQVQREWVSQGRVSQETLQKLASLGKTR